MKSIFKRSSSKNMLDSEETGSATVRAAVAAADKSFDEQDTDPQDQGTKSIARQFSQDGRGIMYLDSLYLIYLSVYPDVGENDEREADYAIPAPELGQFHLHSQLQIAGKLHNNN